ncbi:MAG: hypothetical protein IPJ65_16820 [Archangiaceae bacterium]|nr:hypothetical protein [Archangiaceae bacterium]
MSAPKFDSLDPILTVDPSHVPTERNDPVEAGARATILSADARLEAKMVGESIITLLAYVADEGPFDASMALNVDGNFVTVAFHKGMSGDDMVAALDRSMPPGYQAGLREGSLSEVLIINLVRPQTPASDALELSFLATDPSQMFRWAGRNKLRIEGRASRGLRPRPHLELHLDGYRVLLPLDGGALPLATALRLRNALPNRYAALIELPMKPGGDVTLTILRRR